MPGCLSPRTPAIRQRATAACVVALLALVPGRAEAQKDPFIDAFIRFHSSLAGIYGDEGPQVAASLDQMAVSLAAWDRAARDVEADLNARPINTPSDLALHYVDSGRLDDALKAIEAAIQIEPGRAAFHQFRGLIHEAAGRPAEALVAFHMASTLDPDDPIAAYLLADRRVASASPEDLQPQVATLLTAYRRAGTAPSRRAPFRQLALIEDRVADTPIFSPASYADGFRLFAQRRYQEAIARFRDAMAHDPLVADRAARSGRMAEGIAALRRGQGAAAIEHLEAAVMAAPASSEAHRILGIAHRAIGNHAGSVEQLNAALQLAPHDERARVGLGRALSDAGRTEEAERALRDTIRALPASAEAYWAMADVYEEMGRGIDAIRELETAASFTVLAGKSQLYWRLAELWHRHQDYERVVTALSHRARLMPNEAGAHKDLGLAYVRVGRQDQALIELTMSALLGLEDAETLAAIGQIHLNAGQYPLAEEVLRRAVAMQPDFAQARYALGSTLLRIGKAEEGKVQLAEFQRLRAAALDEQRRAFEIETLIHEADLRTREGRNDLAAGIWQKVVDREPRNPAYLTALADALARTGQLESAVRHLETAAAGDAGPEVYRQLAALYAKLGRVEEGAKAQATYERLRQERPRAPGTSR
jgi:tetratricopeptide (TPR) repeat protein